MSSKPRLDYFRLIIWIVYLVVILLVICVRNVGVAIYKVDPFFARCIHECRPLISFALVFWSYWCQVMHVVSMVEQAFVHQV
jgi:hypothetical protein